MLLNGTTSRAQTSGLGGVSSTSTGAMTLAAIVRRNSTTAWDNIVSTLSAGNQTLVDLTFSNTNVLTMEGRSEASSGPTLASTGTYYVAADKPAGTSAARFHRQLYGTDAAVTHSATTGGSVNSGGTAAASIGVGSFDTNADWFDGDIYVVGIWNRQLADWEHEYLASSMSAWLFLSPDWLKIELAASLPANIPDLSGKGAPLTTLTNLAVSVASVPVGWGAPMPETFQAPAGGGSDATVTAVPQAATGALPAPAVTAGSTITSPPLAGTGALPAPSVSVTVNAVAISGTGAAPAPAVTGASNVTAPPLAGTGAVPVPTIAAGANVTAPPLAATGALPAPAATATSNITAPPLAGTGALPAPFVTTGASANVTAPPLAATGALPAPGATATSNITAAPLAGTGAIVTPTINASSTITAPPLAATGALPAPQPAAGANVTAPPLTGLRGATTTTVSGTVTILSPPLAGTGDLVTPVPSGSGSVLLQPPPLTATGALLAPAVAAPYIGQIEPGQTTVTTVDGTSGVTGVREPMTTATGVIE